MHYHNRLDTISVHDLPLNSEVLIWHKSSNWTRPYHLLAVKDKICCIQLFSRPTSFRNIFIKPYFQSKNTHDVKPDKPKAPTRLDKLKVPLFTLEVPQEFTEPVESAVKHGQRHPQKHPIIKNPMTKNYLASAGISVKQSPPANISVLVQETLFTDL